ncbi:GCN5-related N-acetyltransferase [Caldicellulosiruptor acetigenus I77R1B]|uniref:GCN5-related N-acetyltransferase n=1 Tax=Caldicellulosiruptor acetigenus (strain ATCC 700853 / DSM 12137 / I77R1B) TaxID=632335 RepID=E4S607_CALA7|nr:GNAT family N-acetyltransferase [Caldicellulosiruptor acetigenus]ADQ39680.1 GCN5-related N-acetyltransferase [Caldicellulosiruptor acetigenus I77R1B]WAM36488.1 GNAT family N-acetyltransferase [Caldicellulosiruptor acetigenus]
MDFIIRPVKFEDAEDINEMRRMDGVRETILSITSERIADTEDFIKRLGPNDHVFVAEVTENGVKKVVGIVGLHVNSSPRLRHSAKVGIMVHRDYQGKGIGRALLNTVLDLADNWLKLVRVELTVLVDNEKAIKLYESLGFKIEGIKKYAVIKNGKYADEYIMARYNL